MKHARHDVIAAVRDAARRGDADATLALVVEIDGSTYVAPGAMALFGAATGQAGWLSGGCLEPAIETMALEAARAGRVAWIEIDTRDDEDLLSGSALGCRGRLRIALLPVRVLPGIDALLERWLGGRAALDILVNGDGSIAIATDALARRWQPESTAPGWTSASTQWRLRIDAPPEVLVFGAGPETPTLLPLLREMGWRTTLAERRPRWRAHAALADRHFDLTPTQVAQRAEAFDAALVMHHNFELDREALQALTGDDVSFVGLLGPLRRREDLFLVLPPSDRDALLPRLRSPVGLKLGGQGPQAIALSIVAQLQAWRHGDALAS